MGRVWGSGFRASSLEYGLGHTVLVGGGEGGEPLHATIEAK